MRAWRPSAPKHPSLRRTISVTPEEAAKLPSSFFDKDFTPVPTYDQGQLGSCTAQAACYSYRHVLVKRLIASGKTVADLLADPSLIFAPSRLFVYDEARKRQGTPLTEDSGSDTDTTNAVLESIGVCDEKLCPYSDDETVWSKEPGQAAVADAPEHKELLGYEPASINAQKHSIVQGYGVQFGFTCYEGLMSEHAAKTGEVPMPASGEQSIGGHEMYKCGFDDNYVIGSSKGVWIVAQSWGTWGATYDGVQRYALLPYDYDHEGLASDNRTVRLVSP
jgi:C1A family cysteine protease